MKPQLRVFLISAACAALYACASAASGSAVSPTAAPSSAGPTPVVRIRTNPGESFSPETGPAAVKAFVPDIAATDSGGECRLLKGPGSSKVTIAAASFPDRATSKMNVSLTFDSVGHLVRYSESRGYTGIRNIPPGATEAVRDSLIRAAQAATRSTTISLDYAIGQGIVHNKGGGKLENAVLAAPKDFESLPILGPIKDRLVRVRRLCGV
jgi:hypothetical protein